MIFICQHHKYAYLVCKKTGDTVKAVCSSAEGRKIFSVRVLKINGHNPQVVRDRVSFEHLTQFFLKESLI
jgi:transcription termination factor Rho